MAENILQRGLNYLTARLAEQIVSYLSPEQVAALKKNREYYEGTQKKPLKVKPNQADDNLIVNLVGLAVNRANSMLFGGGVDFTVPSDPARDEWIKTAWKANKQNILLHRTGLDGELFGTCYMKILPEALEYKDAIYPRLVLLDPSLMAIETDPMDIERVMCYVFEMKIEGEDKTVREKTRRAAAGGEIVSNEFDLQEGAPEDSWIVETWESRGYNGAWILIKSQVWPYPFPPIIHWQNLPSIHSVYGVDGTCGSLDIQDKYNFVISNALKILRYHAHPKTWGRGFPSSGQASEKVSWGGEEMIKFTSENAMVANLEMHSDLSSTRNIAQDLRQLIFDMFRVVDVTSMKDKVGALTNFGLRVLYSDAVAKNSTRRELYGDALLELNRRMMILDGFTEGDSEIHWGPDLPQDEKEDAELVRNDLQAGIVSKETASTKRGYVWATTPDGVTGEKDKIANEKAADGDAANAALARLFAGTEVPQ